jgi:hypothetical protein
MNCEEHEDCPAKEHPEMACWELAHQAGDYRNFCRICQDCIVYILKKDPGVLTESEKKAILERRAACPRKPNPGS